MGATGAEDSRCVVQSRSWWRRFARQYTSLLRKNRECRRFCSALTPCECAVRLVKGLPPLSWQYSLPIVSQPASDQSYEPAGACVHETQECDCMTLSGVPAPNKARSRGQHESSCARKVSGTEHLSSSVLARSACVGAELAVHGRADGPRATVVPVPHLGGE